ncbi:MAG: hypothetical protein ACRDPG_12760 [Nocardioidaceae bacterium]
MITNQNTAAVSARRVRMPVFLPEMVSAAPVFAGRRIPVGAATGGYAVSALTFQKDAVLGVRAWSPPV